jgi:hypothetical protein
MAIELKLATPLAIKNVESAWDQIFNGENDMKHQSKDE